ncbi:hypothetical protein KQX54_020650 [Cotesia glomerata]|uniref:DNA-directed DNA polymerase n=1 Tax=Cotesia glomerata TaxID=32391 RepID=A0AAV7IHP9_COTGL|nr:hypothetical protein KQX54_020650 [Cotesia glomerata]
MTESGVVQSEYKLNFIKRTHKKVEKFVPHDCFAVTNDEKQIDPRVATQWKLSDEESQALVDKIFLDRFKSTYQVAYNCPDNFSKINSEIDGVREFDSEYKRYSNDLYFEPSDEINLAAPPTAKRKIEDETRDFLTTYSKDYQPKKISKRNKFFEENFLESEKLSLNTLKSTIEQVKIPVKTIYQYDFCSLYPQIKSNPKLSLSDDWIVPETVYKSSYRDCYHLNGFEWTLKRPVIEKPMDNLRPNLKEREILRVTTGDSEYAAVISKTGKNFLK